MTPRNASHQSAWGFVIENASKVDRNLPMKRPDLAPVDKVCTSGSGFTLITDRSCITPPNPTGRSITLLANNMKNHHVLVLSLLMCAVASPALGQHREFTNQDGRVMVAIPLSKTKDSVKIQSKDGKEYTVSISKLSEADQQFLAKWAPPSFTNRVIAFPKAPIRTPVRLTHCAISISP